MEITVMVMAMVVMAVNMVMDTVMAMPDMATATQTQNLKNRGFVDYLDSSEWYELRVTGYKVRGRLGGARCRVVPSF